MIIMPMTRPAASADSEATSRPSAFARSRGSAAPRSGPRRSRAPRSGCRPGSPAPAWRRRAPRARHIPPCRSPRTARAARRRSMAMKVISSVPASSGTKPKDRRAALVGAIAVCGAIEAEQEIDDAAPCVKKTQRLEQHREDDADGGEDGDRRAGDQHDRDEALEVVAGAEIAAMRAGTQSGAAAPADRRRAAAHQRCSGDCAAEWRSGRRRCCQRTAPASSRGDGSREQEAVVAAGTASGSMRPRAACRQRGSGAPARPASIGERRPRQAVTGRSECRSSVATSRPCSPA